MPAQDGATNSMIPTQGRKWHRLSLSCLVVALVVAPGCASRYRTDEVWTAKPIVSWADVGLQSATVAENGYALAPLERSVGIFPANIGVTRVAVVEGEDGRLTPVLDTDPRNEFLRWNYTFDDLLAVSDVFPIIERDLGGGGAGPDQILAAFNALHAKLGLIYAMNELSDAESEMLGTLYNAKTGEPLASIHASAVSVVPDKDSEEAEDPYYLWSNDSRAIVRDRFAASLHDCMRALILRDQPAALEDKSGWTPAGPIRPTEWPPRYYKSKYRDYRDYLDDDQ